MRSLAFLLIASTLASCATAPQPLQRSERAQARLSEELAGLTAGEPQACIPHWDADRMVVIDDNTILFRDSSNRVYRNEVQGPCNLLSRGYTLVLRSTTGSLCRGEIGTVVDLLTDSTVGSCALGDFVPYTRT